MSRIRDSYLFRGGIVLKLLKNDLNRNIQRISMGTYFIVPPTFRNSLQGAIDVRKST